MSMIGLRCLSSRAETACTLWLRHKRPAWFQHPPALVEQSAGIGNVVEHLKQTDHIELLWFEQPRTLDVADDGGTDSR